MAWFFIVAAGIAEIAFAGCLGASQGMTKPVPAAGVAVFGALAVALLSRGLLDIPLSTGYAAFTAIGALGTVVIGVWLRDESTSPARIAAIALVVVGVVALRLTSGAQA